MVRDWVVSLQAHFGAQRAHSCAVAGPMEARRLVGWLKLTVGPVALERELVHVPER